MIYGCILRSMPKADKLFFAALGFSVILGVVLGLAIADFSDPVPKRIPYGNAAAAKADYETRRASSTPNDALSWIDAVKQSRQRESNQQPRDIGSEAEKYHDALDLEAQWAAASAAERMVRLTIWQIVSGGVGIFAVVWSLIYTRKAVEVGTRAAIAAEASVVDAQNTAKQELRAYVYFDGPHARPWPAPPQTPNRLSVIVDYVNGGQTWAHQVVVKQAVVRLSPADTRDPFETVDWKDRPPQPIVLGPNQRFTAQMGDVPYTDFPPIRAGVIRLLFMARAQYRDVFGTSRETRICSQMGVDSEGGYSFTYVSAHNCADDGCPKL